MTAPDEPAGISAAERAFVAAHPEFDPDGTFAELRRGEYGRLDDADQVYLDYTGGGLYARVRSRPTSRCSGGGCSATRTPTTRPPWRPPTRPAGPALGARLLRRRTRSSTPSSSPPTPAPRCGSSASRTRSARWHASCSRRQPQLGQRHPRVRPSTGASVAYVPLVVPDLRVDRDALTDPALARGRPRVRRTCSPSRRSRTSPASSTRSNWSRRPRARLGRAARRGGVRADQPPRPVAGRPDFVTLSFYKMFGYPTGHRLPDRRHDRWRRCERPWFAGGTITSCRSRATVTTCTTTTQGSRTAPSTSWTCRPIEIGLDQLERIGRDPTHDASACSPLGCSTP